MIEKVFLVCKSCGKEFINNRRKMYCNSCSKKLIRKRGSDSTTKRMIRNREFIKDYKKNKKCEKCGYNKCPDILVFHHKKRENKSKGVNTLMKTLCNLDKLKEEIRKCVLICPNCHGEIHFLEKLKQKNKNE